MGLEDKTIVELRAIAQGYGVDNIFRMKKNELVQAIRLKQEPETPDSVINIPPPDYDRRIANKPPAKLSTRTKIEEILARHVQVGLNLSFDEERWYMTYQGRTDEGTLRMPLRVVLRCADKLMTK